MSKHGPIYERQGGEKYHTPAWVTESLLDREELWGPIWEPAAGAGNIIDVLSARGFPYIATDLEPERADIGQMDFLHSGVATAKCILGNPPFGIGGRLAVAFIEEALRVTKPQGGKVAMLLPLTFDAAKGRRHIFGDHPAFAGQYVLTQRIRWANLEQKKAGPMEHHAWFIWCWRKDRAISPFKRYI